MNEKYPLALPEGTVLAGQYIVEKVLGQGGFGITYEAKDHKTGRRVAVKEFFPDAMARRAKTMFTERPASSRKRKPLPNLSEMRILSGYTAISRNTEQLIL